MREQILADTSFMFAVFDNSDAKHGIAQTTYKLLADQIALLAIVLPERSYHLERTRGTRKVAEAIRILRLKGRYCSSSCLSLKPLADSSACSHCSTLR
jgi:predicted nucleic acid-binding protein